MIKNITLYIILSVAVWPCFAQVNFEIKYLGNMGVAITCHDSTIIIDGIHDYYDKYYLPTDSALLEKMFKKEKPFSKIVAIAFSHYHNDHFDSLLLTKISGIHSTARLVGPQQVKVKAGEKLSSKFFAIGDKMVYKLGNNLIIAVNRTPHINPSRHAAVQNLRTEIEWNGKRFIHFGDADLVENAVADLRGRPDLAIVPDWFNGKLGKPLLEKLDAKNILLTHIEPGGGQINFILSNMKAFSKYGDRFDLNKDGVKK